MLNMEIHLETHKKISFFPIICNIFNISILMIVDYRLMNYALLRRFEKPPLKLKCFGVVDIGHEYSEVR